MIRIEYGYDRKARSWCIIALDQEGNQLLSSYVGDLKGLESELEFFQKEFKTTDVTKIPPY